ncbi:MAG: FAD:protein FMN transferase [Phycisphaerales bacterium]|jgi:thiamine biosynthesis lipoprotein|nr:FAD:protein FMN transferase [Phycisphaerales bacterium]
MKYVLAILGLGIACAVWMLLQLWTGKKSKDDRWRGGGGCSGHLILVATCLQLVSCSEKTPCTQATKQIMGTQIQVTAPAYCHEIVFRIFEEVDQEMSEWKQHSPLTSVNKNAGKQPTVVPPELFDTVKRSLRIAELSEGAFDPTWASLWNLWKFDGTNFVPTQEQVDAILPTVSWRHVVLNAERTTITLPKGSMLGLGAIAKGVALDKARDALLALGEQNFMIVAGGQVLVHGRNNGRLWRIGIRDPEMSQNDYFAVLDSTDTCLSTSGNYEKFFIKDGVRYHHIIDPRTGFPARGTKSVTVICKDATLADALSTACFVLSPEQGISLCAQFENIEVLIIDSQGSTHQSKGFPL